MSDSDSECSSDSYTREQSPGPADPEKCTVTGGGFSGGAAGELVSLTIISKDSRGIRVREGGINVRVCVTPTDASSGGEPIEVTARDNEDGTYSAQYQVESRGNYTLSIAMNGTPIGGSPFPVFFSLPQTGANANGDATAHGVAGDNSILPGVLNAAATAEGAKILTVAEATQALGGAIVNTLYISNISPTVQVEQLKQLFAYCGKISDVHFIGDTRETALVEFTTALEARCAAGLNGVMVGDRPLRVQLGTEVVGTGVTGTPYMSIQQVQQLQQVHSTNQHATQLAAQLASLRAIARTALLPAIQEEEKKNSGKKAAFAAAAELTKKLDLPRRRSDSRSRSPYKKRRSRSSPRRNRRRSRSRSRTRLPVRKDRPADRRRDQGYRPRQGNGSADRSRRERSDRRIVGHDRRSESPPRHKMRRVRSPRDARRKQENGRDVTQSRRDRRRDDRRGGRDDKRDRNGAGRHRTTRDRSRDRSDRHRSQRDGERERGRNRYEKNGHAGKHEDGKKDEKDKEDDVVEHEECNGKVDEKLGAPENPRDGRSRSRSRSQSRSKSVSNSERSGGEKERPPVGEEKEDSGVLEEMRQKALQAFLKRKGSGESNDVPATVENGSHIEAVSEMDVEKVSDSPQDAKADVDEGQGLPEKKSKRSHRRYRKAHREEESPSRKRARRSGSVQSDA